MKAQVNEKNVGNILECDEEVKEIIEEVVTKDNNRIKLSYLHLEFEESIDLTDRSLSSLLPVLSHKVQARLSKITVRDDDRIGLSFYFFIFIFLRFLASYLSFLYKMPVLQWQTQKSLVLLTC